MNLINFFDILNNNKYIKNKKTQSQTIINEQKNNKDVNISKIEETIKIPEIVKDNLSQSINKKPFISKFNITDKEQVQQHTYSIPEDSNNKIKNTETKIEPPIKTYNATQSKLKKQYIAFVSYLKNHEELVILSKDDKINIKINNINDFNFENPELNATWHKSLKNFLFKNLMFTDKKHKIFVELPNTEQNYADIYFDYEKKESLYNQIKNYHQDFIKNLNTNKFKP